MKTITINALNSCSGGGRSIRDSFLKLLDQRKLEFHFVVLVPPTHGLDFITNENIEILELPGWMARGVMAPVVYRFVLGSWLQRIGADVVFNLGDLIIHTPVPQIYLFDWPYALDVHPRVWATMKLGDRLNRGVKLALIRQDFSRPAIVIAQTEHIKGVLEQRYALQDVRVVGNAVTRDTRGPARQGKVFDLPKGCRLLYPALYYPHKNHEVLLDVAELIRQRGLDYHIIVTVSPNSGAARVFLDSITKRGLEDIIINTGQLPLEDMKSLYRQCDALLMPTLLESFSISYVEAMDYGLPIFTSDMWFAHSVCGEAAAYFDPLDAGDILRVVDDVMSDKQKQKALVAKGKEQLGTFPSWEENLDSYLAMMSELLAGADQRKRIS